MTLPPNSLPLRLHMAPGYTRQPGLLCPLPDSDILFLGWGSIGPLTLPATADDWPDEMRSTLERISDSRYREPNENIVVLGCERYRAWCKKYPKKRAHIDLMMAMIECGMKGTYGLDVPFAYSGPEDALWGDLWTPMIGAKTTYNPSWGTVRRCLPFLSPIYGATVDHAASIVTRLALGPGLPHGVCLWCQDHTLAGQQATVDFGLAVNDRWIKHLAAVSAEEEGTVTE